MTLEQRPESSEEMGHVHTDSWGHNVLGEKAQKVKKQAH